MSVCSEGCTEHRHIVRLALWMSLRMWEYWCHIPTWQFLYIRIGQRSASRAVIRPQELTCHNNFFFYSKSFFLFYEPEPRDGKEETTTTDNNKWWHVLYFLFEHIDGMWYRETKKIETTHTDRRTVPTFFPSSIFCRSLFSPIRRIFNPSSTWTPMLQTFFS